MEILVTLEIPSYPTDTPKEPDIKKNAPVDAVARSLARPDAFAKPATIGKSSSKGVRVRLTNQRMPGRPKRKKRDYRDVKFY